MRVASNGSTWATSGEGDSATADALGRGTLLLSQLLQKELGPLGPPPPSSSSSSESDEGGPPGTGLSYEVEWWPYEDHEGNSDAADGTAYMLTRKVNNAHYYYYYYYKKNRAQGTQIDSK